jgi:hypothetical protein
MNIRNQIRSGSGVGAEQYSLGKTLTFQYFRKNVLWEVPVRLLPQPGANALGGKTSSRNDRVIPRARMKFALVAKSGTHTKNHKKRESSLKIDTRRFATSNTTKIPEREENSPKRNNFDKRAQFVRGREARTCKDEPTTCETHHYVERGRVPSQLSRFLTQPSPNSAFFQNCPQLGPLLTQPFPNSAFPNSVLSEKKNQKDTINSVLEDFLQSFPPNGGLRPPNPPS